VVPSALLTALSEEQLDLEERIQRCQKDARQLLSIRPDVAWSRARQAVSLLGDPHNAAAILDDTVRRTAENTLAEVAFCLAFRKAPLAPELGRLDLFAESALATARPGTSAVIRAIGAVVRADHATRLPLLGSLAQVFAAHQAELDAWLCTEIAPKVNGWLEELESAVPMGENALSLAHIVPPFYRALRLPDADARAERTLDRCVRHLLRNKRHQLVLEILPLMKERRKEIEAECLEAIGEYGKAGEAYRSLGKLKEALACYRSAPDFESAVALIREIPEHPAAQSYDWLMRLKTLVDQRPENFSRVMTTPEKKILERMLEQALGVSRKKPAARKMTAKKPAPKSMQTHRAPPPRQKQPRS
jgi:tetratricopeptide (TPR) repeat protein